MSKKSSNNKESNKENIPPKSPSMEDEIDNQDDKSDSYGDYDNDVNMTQAYSSADESSGDDCSYDPDQDGDYVDWGNDLYESIDSTEEYEESSSGDLHPRKKRKTSPSVTLLKRGVSLWKDEKLDDSSEDCKITGFKINPIIDLTNQEKKKDERVEDSWSFYSKNVKDAFEEDFKNINNLPTPKIKPKLIVNHLKGCRCKKCVTPTKTCRK